MKRQRSERTNVLFVCSQNRWRSPTAEKIYQRHARLNVRSRGTSSNARRAVRQADIAWADVIMVMEPKHQRRLRADFPESLSFKDVHVLDIPDDYRFMDPELVELIEAAVEPLLNEP